MNALKLKKGDTVIVLSGKDRGKRGKVVTTDPAAGKLVVEGVNMVTAHKKPKKQGDPSGIVKHEAAILACKVMIECPKCHTATRIATQVSEDGTKTRACKHCGAKL